MSPKGKNPKYAALLVLFVLAGCEPGETDYSPFLRLSESGYGCRIEQSRSWGGSYARPVVYRKGGSGLWVQYATGETYSGFMDASKERILSSCEIAIVLKRRRAARFE